MTSDRIKEIQQTTAYPDSLSVQQALLQVWNECEQDKSSPSDNTQIRDGWVRMEDMEKEYKRGFDDGVKYRDGQHKAYFTIES